MSRRLGGPNLTLTCRPSQQQRFNAMSMYHRFAGRPVENCEASILGGHEGDRITLILHELGSRQVPGPAEFLGMDLPGASALDRFRYADEVSNPSPVKYALLPFSDCMRESL